MRQAGLNNVSLLQTGDSQPLCLRRMARRPGKPTVFLYAHHDVQPINFLQAVGVAALELTRPRWPAVWPGQPPTTRGPSPPSSAPSPPTSRRTASCRSTSRCWSRARKKSARATCCRSSRNTRTACSPTSSSSATPRTSRPACRASPIRCAASSPRRSRCAAPRCRSTAAWPAAPSPTPPLPSNVILSRLYWNNGKLPIPGIITTRFAALSAAERKAMHALPAEEAKWREDFGILPRRPPGDRGRV